MLEREKLSPKQAETVEIILDNTRHLVRLLNDLLDLARSDAGRLTIKPVPTEVGAADRGRGADDARPRPRRAGQTLSQEIEPGLPLVDVEPDRIRQVLVNLLTNAHEYCPEGASIGVTARARRCRSGDRRERRRTGHARGPAGAHLRALHPRRRGPDPARRRHRPRPGDLQVAGRAARRHDRRRARPRARARPSASACRRPPPAEPRAPSRRRRRRADGQGPGRRRLRDDPAAAADPAGDGGLRGRDRRRRPGGDRARCTRGRAGPTSSCSTR